MQQWRLVHYKMGKTINANSILDKVHNFVESVFTGVPVMAEARMAA